MRSPSAVDRSAASWRSSAVRQPLRRKMTYVSIAPLSDSIAPDVMQVDGRDVRPRRHRRHHPGWERRPPNLEPPLDRCLVSGDDSAMVVAAARGGCDLLEREPVLEGLHKAFADACEGRGGIVLVPGEAGVGKTLVLRRFCDEVRDVRSRAVG